MNTNILLATQTQMTLVCCSFSLLWQIPELYRFSFAVVMLYASLSDIGVDSNLKLSQAGHFSLYVLSAMILAQ
jgi:hypothetical protein